MAKKASVFVAFWLSALAALGQPIIENPDKPASPRAGRVVRLKEVLRITDAGGKFFFSSPWAIHVANDGFFYVQEPEHLYQFDADGKYIKDLCKKGEGPGEFNQSLTDALILDNEIILHSSNANKIVRLQHPQGNLIEDLRPRDRIASMVLGRAGDQFTILVWEFGERPKTSGFYVDNYRLCRIDRDNNLKLTSFLFPFTKSFFLRDFGISTTYVSRWLTASEGLRYVYLSSTPEYLLRLVDLEKGELVRSFRRSYSRVKFSQKEKVPRGMPVPGYVNDICRLLRHGDNLWVVTSTIDKSKGLLVDVFDREGKYVDNFWLSHFRIRTEGFITYYAPMALLDDFLFVIEITADDLISVVKYEILDQ